MTQIQKTKRMKNKTKKKKLIHTYTMNKTRIFQMKRLTVRTKSCIKKKHLNQIWLKSSFTRKKLKSQKAIRKNPVISNKLLRL